MKFQFPPVIFCAASEGTRHDVKIPQSLVGRRRPHEGLRVAWIPHGSGVTNKL